MPELLPKNLTGGRLLARNTVLNVLGLAAPLLVAFFAIPLLIDGLGTARFGVLTLAWVVVGYFSLFDLGLGRALTQLVAEKLGAGREREVYPLAWTALSLMLLLGLVGGAIAALLSPLLVREALRIPEALQHETLRAFYLLAISIPVVVSTAGLRGILEAQQRFGLINAVRIPMSAFTFLGPLLVMPFSKSVFPVVAVLVASRLLAWLVYLLLCFRVMPPLRREVSLDRTAIGPLLRFGSWMTVSNIVSPLMVYLDRLLIGVLLSVTAVAYYATPYEVVTKLLIFPGALAGVLFPAFSASFAQTRSGTTLIFDRGVKCVFLVLFPIILVMVTFAHKGLDLWLGAEFARHGARVLQLLAIGVLMNSLAHIPFALVQGVGRPDLTAKLHLVELPIYLLAVWGLTTAHGIEGAAIAWAGRALLDALLLFSVARWLLPNSAVAPVGRMAIVIASTLLMLSIATINISLIAKAIFILLSSLAFVLIAWFSVLGSEERMLTRKVILRRVRSLRKW